MTNLLAVMFCLLDSSFWRAKDISSWADNVILKLNNPKLWIVNLSLVQTSDQALQIIREALKEFFVILPEVTSELLVGFTILRFERGEISKESMRQVIWEIIDSYGEADSSLTSIEEADYSSCKRKALDALRLVEGCTDIKNFNALLMN
ncbi:hypothetical protein KFE80_02595 [bacterium SCSIO 12696]|nr:hypothetical protein KFE80_02595 [bacterium SCSIO 12696]